MSKSHAIAFQAAPARTMLAFITGAALLAVASHIRVPMWPVPMTMQPFAVLLIGGAFSRSAGLGAVTAYLGMALAGLPVLAGATAIGGPTTGYLLSYLVVVVMLAAMRDRGWMGHIAGRVGCLLLAMAVIYACGVSWLAAFWLHDGAAAVMSGMLPFLPGDAVKVGLAAACLSALPRRVG